MNQGKKRKRACVCASRDNSPPSQENWRENSSSRLQSFASKTRTGDWTRSASSATATHTLSNGQHQGFGRNIYSIDECPPACKRSRWIEIVPSTIEVFLHWGGGGKGWREGGNESGGRRESAARWEKVLVDPTRPKVHMCAVS